MLFIKFNFVWHKIRSIERQTRIKQTQLANTTLRSQFNNYRHQLYTVEKFLFIILLNR